MSVILGSAVTGAKFTPLNHHDTGNIVMDRICRGDDIPVGERELAWETRALYNLGCRYFHYHARNFETREQTTENCFYARVGRLVRSICPEVLVSFGASRNGSEVIKNISRHGEWERVSQAAIPLQEGGAHFVTTQAAIELQVICDLERKLGRRIEPGHVESAAFLEEVRTYTPSAHVESMVLETNSTANGGNYGLSSPAAQIEVYSRAIKARNDAHLLHEVEWVQFARSFAMTRMAIERPEIGLGGNGHLNVTILFGFSPRLPFPGTYEEFERVVAAAKSLERDLMSGEKRRAVTISAGAAVLPQHAAQHVGEVDIGPSRGERACALRRLAAWVAQPNSGVDILRSGMEDTPYEMHPEKGPLPTSNARLCEITMEECLRNGVEVEVDQAAIAARLGTVGCGRGLTTRSFTMPPSRGMVLAS